MDNVTPIDPSLLAEWSRAIVNADLERVQQLYTNDLLWQPLDRNIARIDTDYAHLTAQLERFQLLGPALGELAALPYSLLDHLETSDAQAMPLSSAQQKRARLVSFLIRKTRSDDLNSWSWGSCHNKTLHLAAFLGQKQAVNQLVERGASMTSRNDLGCTPANVIQQQQQGDDEGSKASNPGSRQSPNRFQQLRAKAESTDDLKKNHQQQHRQQDIARLAQRSAVKNNPLFKKFEQQQQQQQPQQKLPQPRAGPFQKNLLMPGENEDRRTSKMISVLKTKSYVSSSIFRQGEPERSPSPANSSRTASPLPEQEEVEEEHDKTIPKVITSAATAAEQKDTRPPSLDDNDNDPTVIIEPPVVLDELENKEEEHFPDHSKQQEDDNHRWSDSQRSHWSASVKMQHRQSSQSESEQWYDSYEEWSADQRRQQQQQQQQQDDVPSPLRQSMTVEDGIKDAEDDSILSGDDDAEEGPTPTQSIINKQQAFDNDATSVESTAPSVSFSPKQRTSVGAESVDTWPPPSSPYATRSIEDEDGRFSAPEDEAPVVPPIPDDIKEKMAKLATEPARPHIPAAAAAAATTTTTAAAPVEPQQYGNISLRTTEQYASHRISPAVVMEESNRQYQASIENDPPPMTLELPPVSHHPSESSSAFGKLYVRLSSAENILLPFPHKLTTYVRCVVSDGEEYEHASRYEVLGEKVIFDYECIMDARPDMIITVALHVRPDPHVQRKTGLARLFTSARKQRESLPAYVHPEDGAIGQTRFALGHMVQACNQKTYKASFDCFNSWFLRSSRERNLDMLKVVGNLNIEMLYLPVLDPARSIPKTMRECDLALRIRQWHNTCWHSGYLSLRSPGSQFWERHYCRLIGSQLISYASKAASEWKPQRQYDIADAVRLVASTDQVIVTLVDVPDQRVFQPGSIVEDTGRGFFRIAFADSHVDCVAGEAAESEEWVKVLKSMIGRVPLKMPISEE